MGARNTLRGAMACATSVALSSTVGWAAGSPVVRPAAVTGLQCPSRTLCLGISGSGATLASSRAPRSGAGGWTGQSIDGAGSLRLLTCASARWCVAVDRQQRVFVSTGPGRGVLSWRLAPGGPGRHLGNVGELSCPSPRLCVGVAGHYVITSVWPQHGGTAWRQALVNHNAWERSVDCPTITRCVAVSDDGQVLTTANPAGRTPWSTTRLEYSLRPIGSQSVSCPSPTQCVVALGDNHVFSTSDLGASRPTWHNAQLGPESAGPLRRSFVVSCTSADVCAAAGSDGTVWASSAPGLSGQRTWKRVAVDRRAVTQGLAPPSIACAPAGLCVVVEGDGHALSASAITRRGGWRQRSIAASPP
jgi:hypothetical protein